jgi:hypothetical protein
VWIRLSPFTAYPLPMARVMQSPQMMTRGKCLTARMTPPAQAPEHPSRKRVLRSPQRLARDSLVCQLVCLGFRICAIRVGRDVDSMGISPVFNTPQCSNPTLSASFQIAAKHAGSANWLLFFISSGY